MFPCGFTETVESKEEGSLCSLHSEQFSFQQHCSEEETAAAAFGWYEP